MSRRVSRREQEAMGLVKHAPNFVPAEREEPRTVTGEIVHAPEMPIEVPNVTSLPATQQVQMRTNYVDRAKAFSMRTWQLSGITAVTVGAAGWVLTGAALAYILTVTIVTFAVVWGAAFWWDTTNSPDGVARYSAKRMWDEISRMNRAREDAYRKANGVERRR